jgi:hypothetical protein
MVFQFSSSTTLRVMFLTIQWCSSRGPENGGSVDLRNVGILQHYHDRGSRIQFQAGAGSFGLHHRVQNDSGAHLASYQMGTRSSFLGGKAAGAWNWPLTSI